MAQLCPSCNKFAGLEMGDPEVNSVEYDADSKSVSVEVRIVRNSTCCGDEMKEYTFNTDMDVSPEIVAEMEAILKTDPNAEFDVEEGGCDQLEEGGGRYAKSYYGYTLTVTMNHGETALGSMEITDKVAASGMDELT